MKKSLLALAVLGAFAGAAQAQSSVTIYGIIDTGVTYNSKAYTSSTATSGSLFQLNSGNIQGSRIGFKGAEDLGGGLSAVFTLEAGFKNDTGALDDSKTTNDLFRRKSVVGLSSTSFGTVLFGRQTDFADTISALTAVTDFGGITQYSGSALNRLQGTRTQNSLSYTTTNLNGFTANALFGFGETAGATSAGSAYGLGGQYVNGPLGLGLNYYQSKAGATPADTSLYSTLSSTVTTNNTPTYAAADYGKTALKVFNLVGSYQVGPARVCANWSRVKQPLNVSGDSAYSVTTSNYLQKATLAASKQADMYEIGTAYSLNAALKLLAAIDYTTASFDGLSSKGKLTQYNLGTDYSLSKRTDLYAFLSYMTAKNMNNPGNTGTTTNSDASTTAVTVGIRHKF